MVEWSFELLTEELHASDWVATKCEREGVQRRKKGKENEETARNMEVRLPCHE